MVTYATSGTCSSSITFDVDENNNIHSVQFYGGCNGNLKGISKLVEGRNIDEIIMLLKDIKCGFKSTSCPAQLANALIKYKSEKGE